MADKIFADGVYFQKRDGAPSFVVGSMSFKVADLIPFLERHQNNAGYVNIDIKESSKGPGKFYCELNTYKPKEEAKGEVKNTPSTNPDYPHDDEANPDNIPF